MIARTACLEVVAGGCELGGFFAAGERERLAQRELRRPQDSCTRGRLRG
jgi:hypothetical protein